MQPSQTALPMSYAEHPLGCNLEFIDGDDSNCVGALAAVQKARATPHPTGDSANGVRGEGVRGLLGGKMV